MSTHWFPGTTDECSRLSPAGEAWIKIPNDKMQLAQNHCFHTQSKLDICQSSNQWGPLALTRSQQGNLSSSLSHLIPDNTFSRRQKSLCELAPITGPQKPPRMFFGFGNEMSLSAKRAATLKWASSDTIPCYVHIAVLTVCHLCCFCPRHPCSSLPIQALGTTKLLTHTCPRML